MHFRPYPVMTVCALASLAALLWLGTWQVQRAEWKAELIRNFETQADAVPEPVSILCPEGVGRSPVGAIVTGQDLLPQLDAASRTRHAVRMFGPSDAGAPGWTSLEAIRVPCVDRAVRPPVLTETGFKDIAGNELTTVGNPATRYLVATWPRKGPFAAPNDPVANDWHWFDAPGMAKALGEEFETRYYLKVFTGRLPNHLERMPPANHYGYAATWYGMAIAVVGFYVAFHARAGRLRFRKGPRSR